MLKHIWCQIQAAELITNIVFGNRRSPLSQQSSRTNCYCPPSPPSQYDMCLLFVNLHLKAAGLPERCYFSLYFNVFPVCEKHWTDNLQ